MRGVYIARPDVLRVRIAPGLPWELILREVSAGGNWPCISAAGERLCVSAAGKWALPQHMRSLGGV